MAQTIWPMEQSIWPSRRSIWPMACMSLNELENHQTRGDVMQGCRKLFLVGVAEAKVEANVIINSTGTRNYNLVVGY